MSPGHRSQGTSIFAKPPPPPSFFEWQGSTFQATTTPRLTIAFQNINGLRTKQTSLHDSLQEIVEAMDDQNIALIGISEHHLDVGNPKTRYHLSEAIQGLRPRKVLYQFNASREINTFGRLMGGTGILAVDDLTGRITPKGKDGDPMGRWSIVHLRRNSLPPLSVISIYQVCQTPTNTIGDTAWHQQRRQLDLQMRHEHPRVAFIKDLEKLLKDLLTKQHAVIVGGDWNDWIGSPNSQLLQMCQSLQLVDPWATRNPNNIDFATHEKGQHRIDSLFISQNIMDAVVGVRYTPGGLLCTTDHRAVLVDLHYGLLFGNKLSLPTPLQPRMIRSNDKAAVTRFIDAMYQHLSNHNAFERSKSLKQNKHGNHELVEALDKLIGEAGDIGEQRCRRRRTPWYSSQLATARYVVSILRYYVNGLRANIDRSKPAYLRLQRRKVDLFLPSDLEVAQQVLLEHEGQLRDEIRKAETTRQNSLHQNAATAEMMGLPEKATAIRAIRQSEANVRTWKLLTFMSSTRHNQQLDRIDIPLSWPIAHTQFADSTMILEDPKHTTNWKTVTDPSDIEYYLLLRNYQHFGQAQGTPFTVPPLSNDINWTATSAPSEQILTGSYSNPAIRDCLCRSLLQQCKASTALDSVPSQISSKEFCRKIKSWNERTTTSPSGRHLGRYKSLYALGNNKPGSSGAEKFHKKQKAIETVILRILNYCIRTGHPLQRWTQIINTLIFKEVGNYQIHRLRVIHIFEADLNLLYATKWRHLVNHADGTGTVHPSQYGGRPGYEATSLALLEELRLDISYLTRRSLLTFDNDASSCYDCIVINLASLVNRKYGLHRELTSLHGTLLQAAEYRLNTAAGVSTLSYKNEPHHPLYGTGQGSGNSPAIWLLISSMLFDTFEQQCHGAYFSSPDNLVSVHTGITGFVDDTNVVVNDSSPQTPLALSELVHKLCHDAQLWTDLLFLSGGKLELSKCTYHVLQFRFKPDGTPIAIQQPSCAPLELHDPATDTAVSVKFLASTSPHKILGHWKAPVDPQQKHQMQAILAKADQFSLLIASSPLTRAGAWLAYNGKYIASLRYVLPQCWFSSSQLDAGEKKTMHRIVSKCGYARTTPTALLFTPTDYTGAGFIHWTTIQGEGQLRHVIKHWRTNTTESKMLRISLGWAQWQSGIASSILHDVNTPLPHVECRWLLSVRRFLAEINGRLDLDNPQTFSMERPGDITIIDFAIATGAFSASELKILNYCRLYLHVATISEMVNARGTHLMPHMFHCERPRWFNESINLPMQRRPSQHQIHYQWQRFCRMLCTDDLQLGPSSVILQPWSLSHQAPRLRREAYIIIYHSEILYVWVNPQYWTAVRHPTIPGQYTLLQEAEWEPGPTALPVDILHWQSSRSLLVSIPPGILSTPLLKTPTAQDFSEYILQQNHWEQMLLQHITWTKAPFEIMNFLHTYGKIKNETVHLVSDGSAIPNQCMSFGLVFGTSTGITLLEAMGPACGIPSSHRAECTGCLAGALILHHLSKFTLMPFPHSLKLVIMSDNQGMITSLLDRVSYDIPYPNTTLVADWDLLEETHTTYKRTWQGDYTMEWVRGHQDSQPGQELSTAAQYNIRADHLAGNYLIMVDASQRPKTHIMTQTRCVLYIQNKAIHSNYTPTIQRAAAEPSFFQYLQGRHRWTSATTQNIDWSSFRTAARTSHQNKKHLLKLVHDKLPTNHQKSKYYSWKKAECHYCSDPETFEHLCLSHCNPCSIHFRTNLVQKLHDILAEYSIPTDFQKTYMDAVHTWFSHQDNDPWPKWHGPPALLYAQRQIGWKQMFRGFLSKHWGTYLVKCIQQEKSVQWVQANHPSNASSQTDDSSMHSSEDNSSDATPTTTQNTPTRLKTRSAHMLLPILIRTVWKEMSQLWHDHLESIHHSDSTTSPDKIHDLRQQVLALHSLQNKVLADHRDRYFYPNVDEYTQRATAQQMQTYILRYQPVILHSVRQAQKLATSSPTLFTFPGFAIRAQATRTLHEMTQEEPPHCKHTRQRMTTTTRRITSFLTKSSTG